MAGKPDYLLGYLIASGRFSCEYEGARLHVKVRLCLYPVIDIYYVEQIEQLPLVFVDTLCLNVEYGVRVYLYGGRLEYPVCKLYLVVLLDLPQLLEDVFVIPEFEELFEVHGIGFELRPYEVLYQLAEPRIGLAQPPSVCDPVCHVGEF